MKRRAFVAGEGFSRLFALSSFPSLSFGDLLLVWDLQFLCHFVTHFGFFDLGLESSLFCSFFLQGALLTLPNKARILGLDSL
jgi:hypothetical protein